MPKPTPPTTQSGATMKQQILTIGADFAGLIVFYALLYTLGLKAAIAGTIVFLAIDAIRRHRAGLGFPRIYILSGVMAVVFGVIDLFSENPFMIKWEAPISSLVFGFIFAAGARGKSMIEEMAEQQTGENFETRPDFCRFFQLLTWLWALYFALKAALYVWMGEIMPMERLLEIRPIVGTVSMLALVGVMTQGRRLFLAFRAIGLLPPKSDQPKLWEPADPGPAPQPAPTSPPLAPPSAREPATP